MFTKEKAFLIGICDDERYVHEQVKALLKKYCAKQGVCFEYRHFLSGKEVLENKEDLDVLLLDIHMPELDGIELAKQLNAMGIKYKVVLLTCERERFKDGFKIGAFRFVTKPIEEQELFEAINDVRNTLIGTSKISVYANGIEYRIRQNEIYYVMADENQTRIFTQNNSFRSEKSLSQWEEELDERLFFRCHRSFLVNLSKIERIENEIWLISKERISVSRRNRKTLLYKFMQFDSTYR